MTQGHISTIINENVIRKYKHTSIIFCGASISLTLSVSLRERQKNGAARGSALLNNSNDLSLSLRLISNPDVTKYPIDANFAMIFRTNLRDIVDSLPKLNSNIINDDDCFFIKSHTVTPHNKM